MECPKCGSNNVIVQREQTATIGAGTNKVVVEDPKKSKGCLWWITIGWWWRLICFCCKPFFLGRKKKSGLNIHANKTFSKTVAVCQDCGHSWKVK